MRQLSVFLHHALGPYVTMRAHLLIVLVPFAHDLGSIV
jgi:hypothetical protein